MRLYLAGADSSADHSALIGLSQVRYLVSYYYILNGRGADVIKHANDNGNPVFLDSGAFSAFFSGNDIDLKKYTDFCLNNAGSFETIAYLDAIGNENKSKSNYLAMRDAGVNGVPTYHVGESYDFLEWLLSEWKYVAIGGLVPYLKGGGGGYRDAVIRALIRCHKASKDSGGKLHGFGVTTWRLMKSFDWYSVDSTAWHTGRRFGKCLVWDDGVKTVTGRERPQDVFSTARRIGYTGDIKDVIPKRTQSTADYMPTLRFNALVSYYGEKYLTGIKQ